jgi:uncharacterized protein YraI
MYKNKVKEKRKGLPPSRYTIVASVFAVVAFVVLAFLLRGPFIERLTVTPTVVSRLVSPNPVITNTLTDRITITPRITQTPLPVVAESTGTPTPFGIPITLTANTDLRSGPGETTVVVERLNAGDTIFLIGANAAYTWFLVGYRSQESWVNAEALGVAINSLRQLPVVTQEVIIVNGPTLTPSLRPFPSLTRTVPLSGTLTPSIVATASTDIPVYSGPGYEFRVITTLPRETFYQLEGVTENREWYLISYFVDQIGNTRLWAWIPANVLENPPSERLGSLPVINLTQAPMMVTGLPPTGTQPPLLTYTPSTPYPTFPSRTPTPTPT